MTDDRSRGRDRRSGRPGERRGPRPDGRVEREGGSRSGRGSTENRGRPRGGSARGSASRRDGDRRAGGRPTRPEPRERTGSDAPSTPRGRSDEPALPAGLDASMLDREVRRELRSLTKPTADLVAAHLVAAGLALDTDPKRALAHARAARARASRIAAVREAVGIAAYHAGEWSEAITELRTARRISGDPHGLAVIADCERALGRPDRAVRMLDDPDFRRLDAETRAELFIVVAGARRDLGQLDAALAVLARGGLDRDRPRPGSLRLWYAYADALQAAGRDVDAAAWFAAAAGLDADGETDAADRAAALL